MSTYLSVSIMLLVVLISQGFCHAEEGILQDDDSAEALTDNNEGEDGEISHSLFASLASIKLPGVASGGYITLAFIRDYDKEREEVSFTTQEGQSSEDIAQAAVDAIRGIVDPLPEDVFVSSGDPAEVSLTSQSHTQIFLNSSSDDSFSAPPVVQGVDAKVADGQLSLTFERITNGAIKYYVLESETTKHRIEIDGEIGSFAINHLWHQDESMIYFRVISVGSNVESAGINYRFQSVSRLFRVAKP